MIVRIAWITAILIPVLIILSALLSGTDGGNSSQRSPEVASASPPASVAGPEAQKTAVPPNDRIGQAKGQASGDNHSGSGAPRGSVAKPPDGGAPAVTPRPTPPQTTRPKPPRTPRPTPPQATGEIPAASEPPVSESPSATVPTTVTVNDDIGPGGGP
jgi:hypothetical protein